jgi:hypothetical protein
LSVAFMTIIERKQLAAHQRRVGPVKWTGKSLKREKLSNSGDTLKTIVPNYIRKVISGWTNYSGTVISYRMSENEMGYRGSKSVYIKDTVKEQRVDGSCCIKSKLMLLRCTLMGGESRYRFKIPSKQLKKIKNIIVLIHHQPRVAAFYFCNHSFRSLFCNGILICLSLIYNPNF